MVPSAFAMGVLGAKSQKPYERGLGARAQAVLSRMAIMTRQEQYILQLLIDEIRISPDGARMHFRDNGLTRVSDELDVSAGG